MAGWPIDKRHERRQRHRRRDQVALAAAHSADQKGGRLRFGLDAFGDDFHPHVASEADKHADDALRRDVPIHVVDEVFVDLQDIRAKALDL